MASQLKIDKDFITGDYTACNPLTGKVEVLYAEDAMMMDAAQVRDYFIYKFREPEPQGYDESTNDFSWALARLKEGKKLSRRGWNGKDMWIYLVDGSEFEVNREPLLTHWNGVAKYRPHIDMKTADHDFVPWVASQSDLLADDWRVVE